MGLPLGEELHLNKEHRDKVKNLLRIREEEYILKLKPTMNVLKTKAPLWIDQDRGFGTRANRQHLRGVPRAHSTKLAISKKLKGQRLTEETKSKIRIAKGTAVTVVCLTDGKSIRLDSKNSVTRQFGLKSATISKYIDTGIICKSKLDKKEYLINSVRDVSCRPSGGKEGSTK